MLHDTMSRIKDFWKFKNCILLYDSYNNAFNSAQRWTGQVCREMKLSCSYMSLVQGGSWSYMPPRRPQCVRFYALVLHRMGFNISRSFSAAAWSEVGGNSLASRVHPRTRIVSCPGDRCKCTPSNLYRKELRSGVAGSFVLWPAGNKAFLEKARGI
jgi:hypothetical protein